MYKQTPASATMLEVMSHPSVRNRGKTLSKALELHSLWHHLNRNIELNEFEKLQWQHVVKVLKNACKLEPECGKIFWEQVIAREQELELF